MKKQGVDMKKYCLIITGILVCFILFLAGCVQTQETVPPPAQPQDSIVEPMPGPEPQQPEPQQPETQPSPSEMVPRITVEELFRKMEQQEDILIIDTRKGVETAFQEGHIPGAVPASLEQIVSGEWVLSGDRDREIVLYCTWPEEQTSARAALELIDQGFTDVKALKGGYDAWVSAGYPVEAGG
jgi:rhodanese-related sulfurtransferase